uniref:capping protein, Arp2/3 and myosin-I linker protein 3-like n=1 Tax=Epinephelus lanceolatus TaxID=310571 RepID=UPI001447C765|nr:capping protein, Arp2/3 and myosin-I linker protein 3-like [Epinephelus lanceolatus]
MASKEITASGFVSVSKDITESIRKIIDKSSIKFVHGIKLDTKNGKTEDRILVLTTWRLYFLAPKIPAKVESTFNFLEIRALNSHPEHQVIIDTDKSSYSLRFESRENLNHVVSHINFALSRIFNNSIFAPSICHSDSDLSEGSRKYSPSSETSVETQRACGGFSETYAALCDYNGISCKEEVQWDVDTIYHSQDNREFNLLDFSHLESRDLAVIVASMAYNTWFTKLYCKDLRIGSEVTEQVLHTVSKSSSLEEITLENAGLKSDFPQKMSAALSENPASVIHSLNLAHNSLDNQGVSNLIQQVCRLSKGLRLLNLSKTSLTSKGVVSLSQALCSSDEYSNSLLHLDLSKNPGVLSGEDASNLYLFLSQPNCLVHLDLSGTDCSVDSLFGALLRGCCADLSFLNLSKNSFSHRKVKDTLPLFRQFFSSAFSLTYVSLASMKLPPDVLRALLTGLTSNPHINDLHLDISGCELKSAGAAVIQELFPRVSSIGTLDISDNGLDGDLLTVLPALSRHPSLKHLYLGKNFNIKNRVLDEVLQKLVHLIQEEESQIQRSLVRNNQTQRFSQRQALRLHQGLVTSTAEQVMERLCVRVQQQVCVLRGVGEMEEIQAAKQVLKEARNSRALYPSLCELAHVLSVDGPVRQRLDSLAGELAKAADKELQVIVDSMVSLCRELCPLSSSAAERLSPPLSSVSERVSIPRSAIRTALMERAAQDIHRALEEVKLSVVSYLTNSIVDQILQELYATHKTLTRQVSHLKRWDGTCEDGTGWRFNRHRDSLDITDEELSTSIDTIAIKKRSSRTRRIRPVSTRLSLCDDSSSSPPPSVPSYSSPLSRSASWEGLSELPTQGLPLHHVTRVRPRPPRRHKGGHIPAETHCSENGGISPLDDGLPDFYTKRVLPDSQLSSLHKAHSLRRKKRRNMLAIFGFRKNRNQTLSNQGPEPEAEVYGDGCHFVASAPTGTATENVYTLLQPPRSAARAGSPGEGADGKTNDHQGKTTLVLSPPPVPGIPHPGVGGSKHPFFSPREKPEVDSVFEHPEETDKYWVDDKQRPTEILQVDKSWMETRQSDQHAEKHLERQRFDSRGQEKTFGEPRTTDRQTDRYWTESRHPERHVDRQWTVDRHTQRQIDRKIERQWMGGRQIDRSWSENRPTDIQVDSQWTESRQASRKTSERQVQALHLAQRPLPPYPSDRTPSPKQETDPLKTTEASATDWQQQDTQGDRQMCPDASAGFTEGWRSSGGGGGRVPCATKPDPPPQSSKPNLSKLRQRHRLESSDALPGTEEEGETERDPGKMEKKEREKRRDSEGQPPPIPEKPKTSSYVTFSKEAANERNLPPPPVPPPVNKPAHGLPDRAASQGEEGLRPQAPVKPQRNRKAMSCDAGTDRESPNNVEKPPNRKPPVKKPRLPQNRNKSLDLSDSLNSASGHSELL